MAQPLPQNIPQTFEQIVLSNFQLLFTEISSIKSEVASIKSEVASIKSEVASIRDWPKPQIHNLKKYSCVIDNITSRSSGFFFLNYEPNQSHFVPHIGSTYHSFFDKNNQLISGATTISMNSEAKRDIFDLIPPHELAQYLDKHEYFYSPVDSYDFIYFTFPGLKPISQGQESIFQQYTINWKTSLEEGEKIAVFSGANDDLKVGVGFFVGEKDKRQLVSLDAIGGFSGALVSNCTGFAGIVTGEKTLGLQYGTGNLNGVVSIGHAFIDGLVYESMHRRSFTAISPVCEWTKNTIKGLGKTSFVWK